MITRWSGRESRVLREALRQTIREFADRIGVSHRTVSKWEAGGERVHPRPVWLDAYYIDVFPTSNADYAGFVAATGHDPPPHWNGGIYPDRLERHPVVLITWNDACAYAGWAGRRLPSALQWEKAARGSAGNTYPWGQQGTWAKCNVRESGNGGTTPVDCYQSGVSPYGIYDMCGNAWEWCATETAPGRFELKGSAFTSPFDRAAPSHFNDASALMCDDDTGFRCAMPVRT